MIPFLRNALVNIRANRFMNGVTIITIALSILMIALFALFFQNAGQMIQDRSLGGRAVVYLAHEFDPSGLPALKTAISTLGQVEEMTFISRDDALENLKAEMAGQTAFLESLAENPLPHVLDVRMAFQGDLQALAGLAEKITALDGVDQVEYGQGWLGQFLKMFQLFKFTGYVMCSLFVIMALFFTANTVRLTFYARRTEVEIMRLVGATDTFITRPFYGAGLLQGILGGLLGLGILGAVYLSIVPNITSRLALSGLVEIHFLHWSVIVGLVVGSTFLGWFGTYLSLRQVLK